uniref:Putative reverse transcriptase and intron maturase n=1 Tax=Rhexinema sarcinoideum TaxID=43261 RepID=A0A1B2RYR8_9CHLO|nr:putative reverse transcriptase and intron maturase [Rhexinema sarcinoideum]
MENQKPKSKEGWNAISWSAIELYIQKLQKRIYSATKNGDIKLVRSLQSIVINSHQAKLLATRWVTQNNTGKKLAGIDGIKYLTPSKRFELARSLKIPSKSRPLRKIWISNFSDKQKTLLLKQGCGKGPGKTKYPLSIPTLFDKANQTLLKLALEPEWEAKFEPNSYGLRPGRNCHDAMKQIYLTIFKKPKYVLKAEIQTCFDQINHEKLLKKLNYKGKIHKQIKHWLKSGIFNKKCFAEMENSTPDLNCDISSLLVNIALNDLETLVKELVICMPLRYSTGVRTGKIMGLRDRNSSLSLIKYAGDFVVLHENKEVIFKCKEVISNWLVDIGLKLSNAQLSHTLEGTKADLADPEFSKTPGFDFLGFTVRQFKKKYRGLNGIDTKITPAKDKQKKHLEKIAKIVRQCHMASQEEIIFKLNLIIAKWALYYGTSDANTVGILKKMDYLLYLKLRRWGKRKTKSSKSSLNKYWKKIETKKFVFATEINGKLVKLHCYSDFARSLRNDYVKVKSETSPFNGDETYWASRLRKECLYESNSIGAIKSAKRKMKSL